MGDAAVGAVGDDPSGSAWNVAHGAPAEDGHRPALRRVLGVIISLAVVVLIFVGVIPQFASYQDAWTAISQMGPGSWVAIVAVAIVNQVTYVWPYQAVLPGLRYRHGFMETQTTAAISNTVPAGGAVAIGMTFRMFESFDMSNVAISTAVVATGLWNLGFKFALPIVAVTLVLVRGQNTAGTLGFALLGVVLLVVSGLAVWLILRSDASARRVGHLGDRIVNWSLHFFHKASSDRMERALLRFRSQTSSIVQTRSGRLTAAVVASQFAVFALLLLSVRAVGVGAGRVSVVEVLLTFAVARLVGAIPITPGGLGTVDAAIIGMLTGFGASSSDALAADLVWRATTYFPPIFLGTGTYLVWKRGVARGRYLATPGHSGDDVRVLPR